MVYAVFLVALSEDAAVVIPFTGEGQSDRADEAEGRGLDVRRAPTGGGSRAIARGHCSAQRSASPESSARSQRRPARVRTHTPPSSLPCSASGSVSRLLFSRLPTIARADRSPRPRAQAALAYSGRIDSQLQR